MATSIFPFKKKEYGKIENDKNDTIDSVEDSEDLDDIEERSDSEDLNDIEDLDSQMSMYASEDCLNLTRIFQYYDVDAYVLYHYGYYHMIGSGRFFISNSVVSIQKEKYINLSKDEKIKMESLCSKYSDKSLTERISNCLYADVINDDPLPKAVAKEILASQYKIHLMPKPEYILGVLEMLVDSCERNPSIRKLVSGLKVIVEPGSTDEFDQLLPTIVIYPILGHQYAEMLLNQLHELFSFYCNEIGTGEIPRYNLQVNPLLCYSQGDGDFKIKCYNELTADKVNVLFKEDGKLFAWGKKLEIWDEKILSERRSIPPEIFYDGDTVYNNSIKETMNSIKGPMNSATSIPKEKEDSEVYTKMIMNQFNLLKKVYSNSFVFLSPVSVISHIANNMFSLSNQDVAVSATIPSQTTVKNDLVITNQNHEIVWHESEEAEEVMWHVDSEENEDAVKSKENEEIAVRLDRSKQFR